MSTEQRIVALEAALAVYADPQSWDTVYAECRDKHKYQTDTITPKTYCSSCCPVCKKEASHA